MRIVISLLFILSNEMLNSGSAKEHVHFKIHVPEIIKHQIHTKTVFIHIHKPDVSTVPKKSKPKDETLKKKKTYHKAAHHEDWSSWSNYGYHGDYDDKSVNDLPKSQKDYKNDDVHKEMAHKNPFSQYHRDSYMPDDKPDYLKEHHGDTKGYSYPPQYEVTEDVKEIDNNDIEPYMHRYEEGYRKGGESARGHIYSGDVTKVYENKYEEGGHSIEDHENEVKEKTGAGNAAGRYFIDDSEYQHSKKAEKRVSPRIFMRL